MTDPAYPGDGINQPFMTLRDVVMEIRSDVKSLREALEKINQEGSIGTKAELADHESRIRMIERKLWLIIGTATAAGGATGTIVQLLGG